MAWLDIAVHFSIHHSSTAICHDLPFGDQTWQWIFHSSMGSMIPAIKPPFSWRCCLMFPMFLHISSICVPYVPMLNSHISYVLHIYFTMFSHTFFPALICHRYVFPSFLADFPPLLGSRTPATRVWGDVRERGESNSERFLVGQRGMDGEELNKYIPLVVSPNWLWGFP